MSPKGQVVVIAGASSGIGLATAEAFSEAGAHVVLAARGVAALERAGERCRASGAASVAVVPTDVLDHRQVDQLLDDAQSAHGRVDVVVHAAGVMAYGTIEELPLDVLTTVIDTATHGTAHVARAALPVFRSQGAGTLIIVSSVLASVPCPEIGAYIAGKWGQRGMAEVLRLETRDADGVRVCTVSPGAVDTPIYRRAANIGGAVGKPPPPVDQPAKVARAIVTCAAGGHEHVSVGLLNWFVIAGYRLAKPLFEAMVGPLYRRLARGDEMVLPTTGNVFASDDDPVSVS